MWSLKGLKTGLRGVKLSFCGCVCLVGSPGLLMSDGEREGEREEGERGGEGCVCVEDEVLPWYLFHFRGRIRLVCTTESGG